MANEQKKLSYEELESAAVQLQQQLAEKNAVLQNVNEIRDMAYLCMQLLDHKDVLPDPMLEKVLRFLDKLIPIPKEETQEPKDE